MSHTISLNRQLISFAIPVLLILFLISLSRSPVFFRHPDAFSFAITTDLLLTVPIAYYLLIRKTTIPKTTVILFMIAGTIAGTYALPAGYQSYLTWFKTWGLPVIEFSVLTYVIIKVHRTIKKYKGQKELAPDFFTAVKAVCSEIFPRKTIFPVATEIAVIYYGFIHWKKVVPKENEFTHHKTSGSPSLLGAIIFLIIIEAFALHLLIVQWSYTAAWILSALSMYTAIQVFGFLRSLSKRLIVVSNDRLAIRYGIWAETEIKFEEIDSVELSGRTTKCANDTKKLSPLGDLESYNIIIRLNRENILTGFYGKQKKYKNLALYVDDKAAFKKYIDTAIQQIM